ncbi:hypothetical protein ABIA22_001175 [Sinorhizobium fredii]
MGPAVAARLPVELAGQPGEGLGKDGNRAAGVGIGKGRAPQPAAAEVIVVLAVGVPAGFQAAQARRAAQLGIDQHHQMIPAPERLVVGVGVVIIHNPLEAAPIDRFNQLAKNARCETHAPSSF